MHAMAEFYVYVIGLDKKVLNNKKFLERNPNYVEGKPCVYVGQSARPPEERYAQHRGGYKANRFARDFGRYLQPRLFEGINPLSSREEAEAEEEALALRLQKRGYAVWWG